MFFPPRCPNSDCAMHRSPTARFVNRCGTYRPQCRAHVVHRFRCRHCGKTFSRQTFRADYRDHKPDRNARVVELLCSGIGLRQTARVVGMTARNTAMKFRKIARHCRHLNANLQQDLPPGSSLQFDELETYETRRNTRPLTLPILLERQSRCILAARSAPIRASGKKTPKRAQAIRDDAERFGRRPSRSRAAVRNALRKGASLCRGLSSIVLETDEKSTYPVLAKEVFGEKLVHTTTPSTAPRTTWNPLFPINHTEAVVRDLNGRLRRESWLVSKRRWFLNLQLQIYTAFRNFVRPRFNRDTQTPAQLLGWMPQPLTTHQLLSWRQDWGTRSGHPLTMAALPIEGWRLADSA